MGKLIYSTIASLDGYVADADGGFDWAAPDEEVHSFVNELERPIGTYLYGRRMYEVMIAWETMPTGADQPRAMREYAAVWRAADKVVYSRTLRDAPSARTRIVADFDPAEVRALVSASGADVSIGGPGLAAEAIRAGLVAELQCFVVPVIVGGGTSYLPGGVTVGLELLEERRFAGGTVYLRYATTGAAR